jgi:RNA polymerase sigma-70 factor, ECF subfamily
VEATPTGTASLAEVFAAERPRLVGLAYRMTGSRLDAEDIVQDAWLRAERVDWATIERPGAWLTTVVSRLALDTLKSAQRRRESYVGPWLAEPVVTSAGVGDGRPPIGSAAAPFGDCSGPAGSATADPADMSVLADSLALGFLRLLEALTAVERVVLILADVFDTPYRDIAATVDRSPEACRQVASRARRRIRAARASGPVGTADPGTTGVTGAVGDSGVTGETVGDEVDEQQDANRLIPRHDPLDQATRVAENLAAALVEGDMHKVVALLADDVVLYSDGGAAYRAARRPVVGPDRVGRFLANLYRRGDDSYTSEMPVVNGEPGAVVWVAGELFWAVSIRVLDGRVRDICIVRNADKLAALHLDSPLV